MPTSHLQARLSGRVCVDFAVVFFVLFFVVLAAPSVFESSSIIGVRAFLAVGLGFSVFFFVVFSVVLAAWPTLVGLVLVAFFSSGAGFSGAVGFADFLAVRAASMSRCLAVRLAGAACSDGSVAFRFVPFVFEVAGVPDPAPEGRLN